MEQKVLSTQVGFKIPEWERDLELGQKRIKNITGSIEMHSFKQLLGSCYTEAAVNMSDRSPLLDGKK